ncbi:MAG: hypothetical protein M3228_04680 [Actinomycetota bacterium]|nr:hypothetical protein [Actinomycetota bacterium]
MVAPPRPVPTASGAAAGELIVPPARCHRVTDSPPPTGLPSAQRPTVAVVVAEGVALTTLLPAAEVLLQGLAKVEAATPPTNGRGRVLSAPLAGRIALTALYRLWDALNQQLHPYYDSSGHRIAGTADAPHVHSVRVPAADLAVLGQAAHTLAHPTGELAAALDRVNPAHRDALTQLLAVLDTPNRSDDQTG